MMKRKSDPPQQRLAPRLARGKAAAVSPQRGGRQALGQRSPARSVLPTSAAPAGRDAAERPKEAAQRCLPDVCDDDGEALRAGDSSSASVGDSAEPGGSFVNGVGAQAGPGSSSLGGRSVCGLTPSVPMSQAQSLIGTDGEEEEEGLALRAAALSFSQFDSTGAKEGEPLLDRLARLASALAGSPHGDRRHAPEGGQNGDFLVQLRVAPSVGATSSLSTQEASPLAVLSAEKLLQCLSSAALAQGRQPTEPDAEPVGKGSSPSVSVEWPAEVASLQAELQQLRRERDQLDARCCDMEIELNQLRAAQGSSAAEGDLSKDLQETRNHVSMLYARLCRMVEQDRFHAESAAEQAPRRLGAMSSASRLPGTNGAASPMVPTPSLPRSSSCTPLVSGAQASGTAAWPSLPNGDTRMFTGFSSKTTILSGPPSTPRSMLRSLRPARPAATTSGSRQSSPILNSRGSPTPSARVLHSVRTAAPIQTAATSSTAASVTVSQAGGAAGTPLSHGVQALCAPMAVAPAGPWSPPAVATRSASPAREDSASAVVVSSILSSMPRKAQPAPILIAKPSPAVLQGSWQHPAQVTQPMGPPPSPVPLHSHQEAWRDFVNQELHRVRSELRSLGGASHEMQVGAGAAAPLQRSASCDGNASQVLSPLKK
eukprot:TRINITY_DN26850_c0_g1_i2.p1 TRINITY_DN26850_c0_g1~~TRINITY_DN26850_c0_g1_i2.p1  ORF type:complete len:682 (-),score=107.08 TRINITY_DN26850_c0_g1_i2:74-2038(-)